MIDRVVADIPECRAWLHVDLLNHAVSRIPVSPRLAARRRWRQLVLL
jgi:hypothetical protein